MVTKLPRYGNLSTWEDTCDSLKRLLSGSKGHEDGQKFAIVM